MNDSPSKLEIQIMRRVYVVYWYRRATCPTTLKFSALALLFGLTFAAISVQSVVANVSHTGSVWSACTYLFQSFLKTEVAVKALVLAALVLLVILVKDLLFRLRERISLPFIFGFK